MDIEFTEERLRAATTATIEHIEERGNEYVADWAPLDGPRTITFDAVYRSDEPDSEVLRNNRNSGIYLILERDANRAYVGLAKNFGNRFFNGNPNHPVGCQNCRCHGHITATLETCTSHNIINSDRGFVIYILSVIPHSGNSISQAEIEWYYILREHGYQMVNSIWALGKKGYVGRPVISFNIQKQMYHYFPTITEAATTIFSSGANPGWINPMLSGDQNQKKGYTHRYATLDEVREYTEGIDVANMVSNFDSVVVWRRGRNGPEVELSTACSGCLDSSKKHNKRKFILHWISGALPAVSVEHLFRTGQGPYGKSDWPKKKGVSKLRSRVDPNFKPRYQIRWKSPEKPGNSPHQTNKPRWTRRKLIDATIWRERKILDNNLETWNQRKYGSNAKWINFRQPWRFLVRNHFTDWEDGETGLSRVLTIYGGILSLVTAMVLLLIAWI